MSKDFKLIEKVIDGEHISPVLPEHIKNYLIDIAAFVDPETKVYLWVNLVFGIQ